MAMGDSSGVISPKGAVWEGSGYLTCSIPPKLSISPQPVATSVTQLVRHKPHLALCPLNSSAQPWGCTLKQAQEPPMRAFCR